VTAPVGIGAVTMALSAAFVLPLALLDLPESVPGPGSLAAVGALGLFGTGVAFGLFYTMIADVGPTKASLVAYIAPGFAVVYGVLLLGESFTSATAAGLLLIVGGSYLAAQGAPWSRPAPVVHDAPVAATPAAPERSAA
jgi:drug/metabolite transporter (DMT)-like permease